MKTTTENRTTLYTGYESILTLISSAHNSQKVVAKSLLQLDSSAITHLQNEYAILKQISVLGVRQLIGTGIDNNNNIIYLNYIDGYSVRTYFRERNIDLKSFLQIAIQIVETLSQLHKQNVVHQNLTGDNILIEDNSSKIQLIDFGNAIILYPQAQLFANPDKPEGSFTHMAPEQTGRVNRCIDYRTDLYTLGVTFYEMLTGHLPFEKKDAIELIHSHIALTVEPLTKWQKSIPQVINSIILKLLEKNADKRYQTAQGLLIDLEKCLTQLTERNEIQRFKLGEKDSSGRLVIPQKLYGRDVDIDKINKVLQEAVTGNFRLIFLAGYAGVGKTALVRELRIPVANLHGFYLEGKFDQNQRNIPYLAWIQVFTSFTSQLLILSAAELTQWRNKILGVLGGNGKLITDIIPNMELVLGKQENVAELGSIEAQNRFNHVFINFVSAIAQPSHPLVIFLDDLQWIDNASLKLLNLIATSKTAGCMLLIGAYRNNETDSNHPLLHTINTLQQFKISHIDINLEQLSLSDTNELITEALHLLPAESLSLTQLVYAKTNGNAFFTHQMLHTLFETGILKYNYDEWKWQWNEKALQTIEITDNVVDLMVSKIKKLSNEVQNVLKLAACVGNQFDTSTLSIITELSTNNLQSYLSIALSEGLILPIQNKNKFAHDRIQQAAYSLISAKDLSKIHHNIGNLLLNNTSESEKEEHLFDIVNHLNIGQLSKPKFDTLFLAQLNYRAGLKAKAGTAFSLALEYFEKGLLLLPKNSWESEYQLSLNLYIEAIETNYLSGNYKRMNILATTVHLKAQTVIDETIVFETEIKALTAQVQLMPAIRRGLEALKKMGIEIPEEPSWDYVWQRFGSTLEKLNQVGFDGLEHLPEMTSPELIAQTRILSAIGEPAYAAAPGLFLVWASAYAEISFDYKHVSLSPFAYAAYALALCATGQYIDAGNELAKKAVKALEPVGARCSRTRVLNIYGGTIQIWKEHLQNTIPVMEDGVASGIEYGDHTSGSYAAYGMSMNAFFMGQALGETAKRIANNLNTITYFRQDFLWYWVAGYLLAIRKLQGSELNQAPMEKLDIDKWLVEARETNNIGGLGNFYMSNLVTAFILEDDKELENLCHLTKQNAAGFQSTICVPELYFYESLSLLRLHNNVNETITENQSKLLALCTFAAVNFQHKYDLVAAEIARSSGNNWDAAILYQKAINGAHDKGYIQEEALANELAAKFYFTNNLTESGHAHINAAYKAYQQWEAHVKVQSLELQYPQWIRPNRNENISSSQDELLNINSVIKTARAISSEIELEKLLHQFMQALNEYAGAQKGYLIMRKNDQWLVEAEANFGEKVRVLQSHPYNELEGISTGIVNYVIRTQQTIILDDAVNDKNFNRDAHIIKNKSKSILCTPLKIRGVFNSILYFENNLISAIFNEARVKVLEILAAQAAVSIENAMYYDELMKLNKALEKEIADRSSSEQKYRLLADNSIDIISRHTPDNSLRYKYVSPSCKLVLGYEPEELINHSALEFIHPDDYHTLSEGLQNIMIQGSIVVTFRKRRKDGSYIWAETNNRLIRDPETDDIIELVSSTRDITKRREAELALTENQSILKQQNEEFLSLNEELSESNSRIQLINEELIKAKNKAEESDRLKSSFLANMSHEIRTPMNAIMGFIGLLNDEELPLEIRKNYIEIVQTNSETLLQLVNDILDFSMIEAGQLTVSPGRCNASMLIKQTFYSYQTSGILTKFPNVTLQLSDIDEHLEIKTDPVRMRQVLTNLIDNALKYTESGSVSISCSINGEFANIYVIDTGVGISPEKQTMLFRQFTKIEDSQSKLYRGVGLGLAISQRLVEMTGGKIGVKSIPGKGSCFYFSQPIYKERVESLTRTSNPNINLNQNLAGKTVLVCEDEESNFIYIEVLLQKAGLKILRAKNGKEGLNLITGGANPDFILMDIKMPILDGVETTKILKNQLGYTNPIIAQTAYATIQERVHFESVFDGFVTKPIAKEELFAEINRLVYSGTASK